MSEEKKQRLNEYQRNYCEAKILTYFLIWIFFFHCIKMRKELIFNNGYNNYSIDKYYKIRNQLILMRQTLKK